MNNPANSKKISDLVPRDAKIVCVGLNYRSHAEHAGFIRLGGGERVGKGGGAQRGEQRKSKQD